MPPSTQTKQLVVELTEDHTDAAIDAIVAASVVAGQSQANSAVVLGPPGPGRKVLITLPHESSQNDLFTAFTAVSACDCAALVIPRGAKLEDNFDSAGTPGSAVTEITNTNQTTKLITLPSSLTRSPSQTGSWEVSGAAEGESSTKALAYKDTQTTPHGSNFHELFAQMIHSSVDNPFSAIAGFEYSVFLKSITGGDRGDTRHTVDHKVALGGFAMGELHYEDGVETNWLLRTTGFQSADTGVLIDADITLLIKWNKFTQLLEMSAGTASLSELFNPGASPSSIVHTLQTFDIFTVGTAKTQNTMIVDTYSMTISGE